MELAARLPCAALPRCRRALCTRGPLHTPPTCCFQPEALSKGAWMRHRVTMKSTTLLPAMVWAGGVCPRHGRDRCNPACLPRAVCGLTAFPLPCTQVVSALTASIVPMTNAFIILFIVTCICAWAARPPPRVLVVFVSRHAPIGPSLATSRRELTPFGGHQDPPNTKKRVFNPLDSYSDRWLFSQALGRD